MKNQKQYTQEHLNNTLWDAANSARSQVDAGIYKDYALTMLFFKYLSDLSKKRYEELKERYPSDEKRVNDKMEQERFYLPQKASFDYIYSVIEQDNIGEEVNKALHKIEDANKEKLEGIISVDFNSETILGKLEERNSMIRNLIQDFAKIDLRHANDDIIGNSYMYMIEKFGADAGKKAGEFFTVRNVANLVAKLAQPKPKSRICDPCCGSGGLLILAGEEVEKQNSKDYALYGQESTGSTYQLARMNMFLHKKDSTKLEWGDTLNNPLLVDKDNLLKFDTIVANPPFSLKKWGAQNADTDKYNRYWRGIPPKDKGDYAFISHMVETAKPKIGRIAVIVPHGVLFRSGSEGKIRKQLIEENLIDAVIGLPAGLFQTTGIPVAILILDRSREQGGAKHTTKDIFFIEASKEYKPAKAQNILAEEHIDKIYAAYVRRKNTKKFAHKASLKEIQENDYNLNITRYVDTFQEEEPIDIKANLQELQTLEPELKKLERQMGKYLRELNITK